jgi:hypothetical protein
MNVNAQDENMMRTDNYMGMNMFVDTSQLTFVIDSLDWLIENRTKISNSYIKEELESLSRDIEMDKGESSFLEEPIAVLIDSTISIMYRGIQEKYKDDILNHTRTASELLKLIRTMVTDRECKRCSKLISDKESEASRRDLSQSVMTLASILGVVYTYEKKKEIYEDIKYVLDVLKNKLKPDIEAYTNEHNSLISATESLLVNAMTVDAKKFMKFYAAAAHENLCSLAYSISHSDKTKD